MATLAQLFHSPLGEENASSLCTWLRSVRGIGNRNNHATASAAPPNPKPRDCLRSTPGFEPLTTPHPLRQITPLPETVTVSEISDLLSLPFSTAEFDKRYPITQNCSARSLLRIQISRPCFSGSVR